MLQHGLEHPRERFEFARFCLLRHYIGNAQFTAELGQLALHHKEALDVVARQAVSLQIGNIADYRMAWGLLSFLGGRATPFQSSLDSYRLDLQSLCQRWGLAATWCAPSLHVALIGRKVFPDNFYDPDKEESLTPFFTWDVERQGEPPYDTVHALLRVMIHSDSPGRQVDTRLVSRSNKRVYYDPRTDRWADTLAAARKLLGKQRLSAALKQTLVDRRNHIESAFLQDRHTARKKPRRLRGEHALKRWTSWAYLAICPPPLSTTQILDRIDKEQHERDLEARTPPRVVNRPPRRARPS